MLFQECMKCSRPSLIHISEVADRGPPRKIIEIHLCLEHAIEAGLMGAPVLIGKTPTGKSSEQHAAIHPDLAKLEELDAEERQDAVESTLICPTCAMTWAQFQKHGLLGCAHDYSVFSEPLTDLIASMHERHTQHIGKIPPQSSSAATIARAKLIQLQVQLNAAVQGERYEEAAKLRDQLRTMAEPEA